MTLQKEHDFWKKYNLIDVRDEAEYSCGYIEGAKHIPFERLEDRLKYIAKEKASVQVSMHDLPADKTIIVYCNQGNSSKEAADLLREYGYQVLELHGGYTAWLVAIMENEEK